MYFFIYKTVNMINGKFYIGQHRTEHLKDGYLGSGNVLKKAIDKYGRENFERVILEYCSSAEQLNEAETRWITQELVDDHNCYNMKTGGEQSFNISNETKRKMSVAKIGKIATKETRNKLSIIARENNNFKGKHHSEKTKKILREKCANFGDKNGFFGKHHTEETKEIIASKKRGTHRSESSKAKQSMSVSGKNNHFYGRTHTEETKNRIREKRTKYTALILENVSELRKAGMNWRNICDRLNISSMDSLRKAFRRAYYERAN